MNNEAFNPNHDGPAPCCGSYLCDDPATCNPHDEPDTDNTVWQATLTRLAVTS